MCKCDSVNRLLAVLEQLKEDVRDTAEPSVLGAIDKAIAELKAPREAAACTDGRCGQVWMVLDRLIVCLPAVARLVRLLSVGDG